VAVLLKTQLYCQRLLQLPSVRVVVAQTLLVLVALIQFLHLLHQTAVAEVDQKQPQEVQAALAVAVLMRQPLALEHLIKVTQARLVLRLLNLVVVVVVALMQQARPLLQTTLVMVDRAYLIRLLDRQYLAAVAVAVPLQVKVLLQARHQTAVVQVDQQAEQATESLEQKTRAVAVAVALMLAQQVQVVMADQVLSLFVIQIHCQT
jgi:hypothetical protein